ncbi:endonuclease/exonuclease/phosphatase family protein [Haloarchaeobius sp. DFWS5]|uniref:endonuclease/exonuclease/phosphatase family protein n=1 Tax=Haloarchaeobius sp. DFWS5 TaxID=3446114 RepID=UPI003EBB0141
MTALRVATFNVRYDTPDDGDDAWPHRRERVVDRLTDIDADLLGLQEATPHQLDYLREHLPDYEWLGVGRRGGDDGEHVPVAYHPDRITCEDWGAFWLSETPDEPSVGWDASYPRVTTWADCRIDGQPCQFVVTHLDHEGERAREEGARLLREWVDTDDPALVVGDFNATPESRPVETVTSDGLRPAREAAATATGPAQTFHEFTGDAHARIDYVLTSDHFDVRRVETLADDAPYPSDHFPVVADVELGTR